MRRLATFVSLLALAAPFAGCGGGGGDDPVTTDAPLVPSKRDYIVQADTICAQSEQGIQSQAEVDLQIGADDFTIAPEGGVEFKPGRRPSDAEIQRFGTEVVLPRLREQLDDLRSLTPPTGDEQRVNEIYDTAEQGIDKLAKDPTLFADQAAVTQELNTARRLARSYGFFDCGTYSGV